MTMSTNNERAIEDMERIIAAARKDLAADERAVARTRKLLEENIEILKRLKAAR